MTVEVIPHDPIAVGDVCHVPVSVVCRDLDKPARVLGNRLEWDMTCNSKRVTVAVTVLSHMEGDTASFSTLQRQISHALGFYFEEYRYKRKKEGDTTSTGVRFSLYQLGRLVFGDDYRDSPATKASLLSELEYLRHKDILCEYYEHIDEYLGNALPLERDRVAYELATGCGAETELTERHKAKYSYRGWAVDVLGLGSDEFFLTRYPTFYIYSLNVRQMEFRPKKTLESACNRVDLLDVREYLLHSLKLSRSANVDIDLVRIYTRYGAEDKKARFLLRKKLDRVLSRLCEQGEVTSWEFVAPKSARIGRARVPVSQLIVYRDKK